MKNFLLVIIVIFFFFFAVLYSALDKSTMPVDFLNRSVEKKSEKAVTFVFPEYLGELKIRNNTWKVEIASDDVKRIQGLSYRPSLNSKTGLLFIFPDMSERSFWMKDMLLPIDIIFFDADWRIVLIEKNVKPDTFPKIFGLGVKAQYVLEINAEEADFYGWQVGDKAFFSNL